MKKINPINVGIFCGAVGIGYSLFLYFIEKKMLFGAFAWLNILVLLSAILLAALAERQLNGGIIAFKPALKAAFTGLLVCNLVLSVFDYAFYNFIDKSLTPLYKQEQRQRIAQSPNIGEEKRQEVLAQIDQSPDSYPLGGAIFKYFLIACIGFVPAVGAAILLKNE